MHKGRDIKYLNLISQFTSHISPSRASYLFWDLEKLIFFNEILQNMSKYMVLTHWGPVMVYDNMILVNTDWCHGLLPDGTKPLPEPMLTYQSCRNVYSHQSNFLGNGHDFNLEDEFEDDVFKIITTSHQGQWVKHPINTCCQSVVWHHFMMLQ